MYNVFLAELENSSPTIFSIFLDMFKDWPMGTIIGIMLLLAVLALIAFVGYLCFIAIDSWFLPRKRGMGKIMSKEFTPAHTDYIPIYSDTTKTSMLYPTCYPDDWSICVEIAGKQDSISVDQEAFNSFKEGASVIAEYVRGRLSGGVYIKSISHA